MNGVIVARFSTKRASPEVLRQHQLDAATFYRWERDAKAAMLAALG